MWLTETPEKLEIFPSWRAARWFYRWWDDLRWWEKPWNHSQKYITVDNLVPAQACRRVTGENHFLKHHVEACTVQNNRLWALLFISSSITGLIFRDEKCQGNGKRCFVWLVIHLTFYLFGQHTGLPDNLLALSLRKQTQAISSLLRAVSVSQEVKHFIFYRLKNPLIPHSVPLISSSDLIYLWDLGAGGRHRGSRLHLQDS